MFTCSPGSTTRKYRVNVLNVQPDVACYAHELTGAGVSAPCHAQRKELDFKKICQAGHLGSLSLVYTDPPKIIFAQNEEILQKSRKFMMTRISKRKDQIYVLLMILCL